MQIMCLIVARMKFDAVLNSLHLYSQSSGKWVSINKI